MTSSIARGERRGALPLFSQSTWTLVGHLARLALGGVYLLAAAIKAADPSLFAEQIAGYHLTPEAWAPTLARLLLVLEFGLGFALIANVKPRFTLPLGTGVMVMFTGVLIYAGITGYSGDCGCFGRVAERSVGGGVAEDLVFVAFGLLAWLTLRHGNRGRHAWQLGVALVGMALGVAAPAIGPRLDVGHLVTSAHAGGRFDHIVIEEYEGKVDQGEVLVGILDPSTPQSSETINALTILAQEDLLPTFVGVLQGDTEAMFNFLFEHGDVFDGMGHAPRAGLRQFYRQLPVVMALRDGEILAAWHERIPTPEDVSAAYRTTTTR